MAYKQEPPPAYGMSGQGTTQYSDQYQTGFAPPVTQQAGAGIVGQWMPKPQALAGCPPGLEYLTQVDQLLIHQQVELLEVLTGWEVSNKYIIKNTMDQQVYFAGEESECCMRQCCGPQREFTMHISDNMQQEVIRVFRPFKCCAGCCWCANADCCAQEMTVEAPVGNIVGYVRQLCSKWKGHYEVRDAAKQLVFEVWGPCCICQGACCTCDNPFDIFTPDMGTQVGKITKVFAGCFREGCTNANNFSVSFPADLDVKMKATLIGLTFLIDFMFYEIKNNN